MKDGYDVNFSLTVKKPKDTEVLVEPERDKTKELVDEYRGKGRTLWITTTTEHAEKADRYFPKDVKDDLETVYTSRHYTLLKLPVE